MKNKLNSNLNEFKKDSMIYLFGNISVGLSSVVLTSMYTNFFSTESYGEYSLVFGIITLMIGILVGWLSESTIRFSDSYSRAHEKSKLYSTIFISIIFIDILFTVLMLLFIFNHNLSNHMNNLYLSSLIMFISQGFHDVSKAILRANRKSGIFSLGNIILVICKIVLIYVFAKVLNFKVESIFYTISIANTIVFLFNIKYINALPYIKFKYFSKSTLHQLFKYGMPLVGVSITVWILSTSDKYIIKIFGSASQVGIYSVCYSLGTGIFNMIITFMMLSAFPIIVKTWNEEGKEKTEQLISKLIRYYFIVTIPSFWGICSLSKEILALVSNSQYVGGNKIFCLSSLAILLFGLAQYTNKAWELTKNTKVTLILIGISSMLNIILNFIFIPIYGYEIAAMTTVVSYLIYLMLSIYKSRKILLIKFNVISIVRSIIASSIMAVVIKYLITTIYNRIWGIVISFIIGIITYFFVLAITGELNKEIRLILGDLNSKKL
ncbi:polysaccharide biosynthesis C-terminal domain-containing protein [Clostridium sp. Marseille-Q2269]|uniref:lipopolysaccharide biosynthesis protein n=1 Tax=Clostridium sp. Marseille-Q2269 TaxID=2942205 RepID=UPI002073CEF0|nr:polysaccharide biosynthesis C-terminal domain-containing protein [Clostridium sp. Marseille-Q2269]